MAAVVLARATQAYRSGLGAIGFGVRAAVGCVPPLELLRQPLEQGDDGLQLAELVAR